MNYIGKSVFRLDAQDKVTGKALFLDDLKFPGMLFAKCVIAKIPHGEILKIKLDKAEKIAGLKLILDSSFNFKFENEAGLILSDQPLIAFKKARYYGDCVALVAASVQEAALLAASLIKVSYKALPGYFSVKDALKKEALFIHPEGNLLTHLKLRKGNIEEGFKNSDYIIEALYQTPHQEHLYLETQGVIAVPHYDGRITIYGSLQCPYYVQKSVCKVLKKGLNQVEVIQTVTGGGFGGKEDFPSEHCARAALLAEITRQPVKLVFDRREDFIITGKRHPMEMHYKYGVRKDGIIQAAQIKIYADCGAYATLSPIVLYRANVHACGPYVIPNISVDTFGVYTNNSPCGAMRGFGQPQTAFASEGILDEIAQKLGIDPIELRLKNALRINRETATDQVLKESVGLAETIKSARISSNWDKKIKQYSKNKGSKRRGIGAACIYYGISLGSKGWHLDKSGAHLQIWQDGTASIALGGADMGQGAFTVIAQIAASALNLPLEYIKILEVNTSFVPDSGPTVASRTTTMSGKAVFNGALILKERLLNLASIILKVSPSKIKLKGMGYYFKRNKIHYKDLVKEAYLRNINLSAFGWYSAPPLKWDNEISQGEAYFVYAFATQIAEVEIDLALGIVKVLKVTASHDLGKAINPNLIEGQIEGGVAQALGYTLYENLVFKKGIIQNPNLSTYVIPLSLDVPYVKSILVEDAYSEGPFGAKGVGEPALIPTAPAIVNAINNALGVRFRKIPILPEDIFFKKF
ncbi:MAG: xanthine dehydrogenase family protein [Armatimonadetes bacterium]|nr:xanthine dehydrogenase family protein [Armatimonadota bacterium]